MDYSAKILAKTYFDICNIYRKTKVVDKETGITKEQEVLIYNGKCALSRNSTPLLKDNGVGIIVNTHKLFTLPIVDIKAGDTVKVKTLNNMDFTFIAGEPFYYPSHLVTPLEEKKRV